MKISEMAAIIVNKLNCGYPVKENTVNPTIMLIIPEIELKFNFLAIMYSQSE
jgi:hypothetical protein